MTALMRLVLPLAVFALLAPGLVNSRLELERVSEPAQGVLLVARRDMPDPYFAESVVLLVRHSEEGSLGIIINRPMGFPLSQAAPEYEKHGEQALYWGGPVLWNYLTYLGRTDPMPEDVMFVIDGMFFGGDVTLLEDLLGRDSAAKDLRVFAGHAGWAPGQLESELARKDWYLVSLNAEMVFTTAPEALWPTIIAKLDPRDMAALPGQQFRYGFISPAPTTTGKAIDAAVAR